MVAVMRVAILFPDGESVVGMDATDALSRMLGGWNPETMSELRATLARRALIEPKRRDESDLAFLYRLDAASLICVQIINEDQPVNL
jgi:hypothetical protein